MATVTILTKGILDMTEAGYFEQVAGIMTLSPLERHTRLSALHTRILSSYLEALQRIEADVAEQPVQVEGELRTLVQVVGHIAAWDRFAILGVCDILAGLNYPRMVIGQNGYVDGEGRMQDFASVDEFNEYHAALHATWSWDRMREWASGMALTLHGLFTQPHLVTTARLEQTASHSLKLSDDRHIIDCTMGWSLWLLVLEHMAVDHAQELNFSLL